jgi:hypothetical protein
VVLIEGDTGAGKSWVAAELSASPRISQMYWLELGRETTAEQYGKIPGVKYQILDPDGSDVWDHWTILGAIKDVSAEAAAVRNAGGQPVALTIDTGGAIWEMYSEWADNRARSGKAIAEALSKDPNHEYTIGHQYWNDATARWRTIMTLLLKFPGIVIILSRGQEVTAFEGGKPTRHKTWKVEGQKDLIFDVPIWVQLTRDGNPMLKKLRAVEGGIKPGERGRALPGFSLESLIFDLYGWDPDSSGHRQVRPMVAGAAAPLSERALLFLQQIEAETDEEELRKLYAGLKPAVDEQVLTVDEAKHLAGVARKRKAELEAAAPAATPGAVHQASASVELVGAGVGAG